MYAPIFVSATNTDVGKTTLSLEIAKLCKARGIKTLLAKPIETGINAEGPSDAELFLQENLDIEPHLNLEDISFYRYVLGASPFVAARFEPHITLDFKEIKKKLDALQERCDLLIIEGVGGLLVPLDAKNKIVDLCMFLKTRLLMVSSDRLGMLNNLLLNQEYLSGHKISHQILINMRDKRTYYQICKPYIDHLNTTLKTPILEFPEQSGRLLDAILVPC
ncbi:dethiobiotin synthase [Helicobacter baculiformis]|uniref:ATP-dependent dethiobiotin synthetase BioD n=1 Tax=Helicobacter baculiformis TaxID=427351 RepID=A0ABV7ZJD8_9HELI|nr:dethiobiotin synthase [Helicobacter baculiformis]